MRHNIIVIWRLIMIQSDDKIRPISLFAQLEQAIQLVKAGQKIKARDMLRQVAAMQPANQTTWLWLSALATDRVEAESALVPKTPPPTPYLAPLAKNKQWWLALPNSECMYPRARSQSLILSSPPANQAAIRPLAILKS